MHRYWRFTIVLSWLTLSLFAQDIRVYPTHWFAGLKDPSLQLMLHRKDIGKASFSLKPYAGVKLVKTYVPENKNYLFIDLVISPTAKPGNLVFNVSENGKTYPMTYTLNRRDPGNGTTRVKGVNASDLVYLIMPDRFANGDTSNDVRPSMRDTQRDRSNPFSRHGGDIEGVEEKLDYLKDLGVTTVWMTPVIENDMPLEAEWGGKVAGYHGYWFTDHYTIEPRLGGEAAYRSLITSMHSKGMKIIQDAVYNHVGETHGFVLDKPMKDWFNEWPAYQGANHKEEVFFDPNASKLDKDIMTGGWFVPHLPDLNLRNPWLAKFMIQHAIWTTEEFGIDGWRVDTYKYCDEQFMNDVNAALEREFPSITIFGESWCSTPMASAYFVRNNMNFPFKHNLQGVTEFPTAYAMKDAALGNPGALYSILAQDGLYKDPYRNCIFLENHDMNRILSELGDDVTRLKLATGLLLTLRGIPQIYYGTEVLMKNFKNPSDAEVRRDFPGGFPGDGVDKFSPAGRSAAETDYFNFLRKVANYRKTSSAIARGKTLQYQPQNGVYVYFRYSSGQRILCVLNPSDKSAEISPSFYSEGLAGRKQGRDIISGSSITLGDKLTVPAKTFMLVEL
jgi:neopullulanase